MIVFTTLAIAEELKKTESSQLEINLYEDYLTTKSIEYYESKNEFGDQGAIQNLIHTSKKEYSKNLQNVYVNNEEIYPISEDLLNINLQCEYNKCDEYQFTEGYGLTGENPLNIWIFFKNRNKNKIFKVEALEKYDYEFLRPYNYKVYGLLKNKREINIFTKNFTNQVIADQHSYKITIKVPYEFYINDYSLKEYVTFTNPEKNSITWDFGGKSEFYINLKYSKPTIYFIKEYLEKNDIVTLLLLILSILGLLTAIITLKDYLILKIDKIIEKRVKIPYKKIIFYSLFAIVIFVFFKPNILNLILVVSFFYVSVEVLKFIISKIRS